MIMYLQKIIQGRATTMHLGSRRHYLDIIVCDIEGNSGWGGGDLGVEEEEMFSFFASIVSNHFVFSTVS